MMEIMSSCLEILLALEVCSITVFAIKSYHKNIRRQAISKMLKNIKLHDNYNQDIDDMIDILRKDFVHINYQLRF